MFHIGRYSLSASHVFFCPQGEGFRLKAGGCLSPGGGSSGPQGGPPWGRMGFLSDRSHAKSQGLPREKEAVGTRKTHGRQKKSGPARSASYQSLSASGRTPKRGDLLRGKRERPELRGEGGPDRFLFFRENRAAPAEPARTPEKPSWPIRPVRASGFRGAPVW